MGQCSMTPALHPKADVKLESSKEAANDPFRTLRLVHLLSDHVVSIPNLYWTDVFESRLSLLLKCTFDLDANLL